MKYKTIYKLFLPLKYLKKKLLVIIIKIIIIFLKIFSYLFIIRFGVLDFGRLAVWSADMSLTEKKYSSGRKIDIFFIHASTGYVNSQWKKMWLRRLNCIQLNSFFLTFYKVIKNNKKYQKFKIPDYKVIKIPINKNSYQYKSLYPDEPNISFTKKEKEYGIKIMESMGIDYTKKYICFHARDPNFLNIANPNFDWSYHNHRDSNINNYIDAADYITSKNYYSLRMGAITEKKIINSNQKIIDYSNSKFQSHFMDIFLGANCEFFICSETGISNIPEMFRKPCIYTNWTSLSGLHLSGLQQYMKIYKGIIILKKFFDLKKNRYLNFSEIFNLNHNYSADFFIANKIKLEENTPEDIKKVTREMYLRINKKWESTKDDAELQKKFWSMYDPTNYKSDDLLIGTDYLRDNINLLK